ncbi:MAG: ABC transporter ATP-binding protein [Xanthomarina sp.]|uniref:ABC transporter ATP-binding protein n=1 Tax=Xanthomarina gelatinilytica TaxID=1137281 RepID=A0A3D6BTB4_9FLAO|nr:HAD family hydrolase [Xanthomarina sp.]MDX1316493.1 HAD family hydrolase [Xanthomarina gelatinilytica]MAL23327.1 ABC transporter ATP-binding protein [Xanthomarina sp.]MBF60727.1 ABC transporter ATP-binding protein [Xanthomarina sp.]HAB28471.1 ABC transporter ATP-binding protein [Xanthomarina gelatinilytica]HCY81917.1 ABC transporter ATP-binding protein [Xanthomarina gelatinilytica]
MLKAVLFDMDGVIVDTEPLHHKAYFGMFNNLKIEVSEAHYQTFTGQSTINVCKSLCSHFKLHNNPEELVQIKRQIFKDLFKNDPNLQLIDGVLDLIKDYHENGLTLVLASSASMGTIESVFNRFDLDQYFLAKLSGADLKASKPHPEIFVKAAEVSGYNKKNCLVIEDSTNGIKAANAANIFCVGYKSAHSKNQDYSKANFIINDFKEIEYNRVKLFF